MASLLLRNLFFTILQPGVVAGLIPFLILGGGDSAFTGTWQFHHYSGIAIFLAGCTIVLICVGGFAVHGRGTLSPADPTRKLVTVGLYKFTRNPMYVGVILVLAGEAIFFTSFALSLYSLFVFVAFHIFVVLIEEPRLKRDFRDDYQRYCKSVRRWI